MKSFQLQKCWKLLDVHRVSGPCRVMWGDSIRKRNVSPRLFSLECCLHCFTDNQQMLVGFFTPPFHVLPLRNPSGPNRSHAHGFMSKAVVAITLVATEKRRLCGFRNAWMSFQQALFLWGSSSVWICFALMNYKKENPVNAFMFWRWNIDMMKRNCSTMKSCLAARRQSTEIIPPRKTVFRSGRRWYCIFRQHNSQIRNLVTTFTSLFLN